MTDSLAPLKLDRTVTAQDPLIAVDFLAAHTSLPKARLKDAMEKGAAWLTRAPAARRRLRRAKTELRPGDRIALFYDPKVLAQPVPAARCLADFDAYSVWLKPPGLLSQGTDYGDHACLLRLVETSRQPPRPVFLVHRLDREAGGLMLVAHSSRAAGALSVLFQRNQVEKEYRVLVLGEARLGAQGELNTPLDGKEAVTRFQVLEQRNGHALLKVNILTGRLHQIRRHLADAGLPVLGDPRYGHGNKDPGGLRLAAVSLAFRCPLTKAPRRIELAREDWGF